MRLSRLDCGHVRYDVDIRSPHDRVRLAAAQERAKAEAGERIHAAVPCGAGVRNWAGRPSQGRAALMQGTRKRRAHAPA